MEPESVVEHFESRPCPTCKAPLRVLEVYGPESAKFECEGHGKHGWKTFLYLEHARAGADYARVQLVPIKGPQE